MGALLLRQSGTNFDGRNSKKRNNKDMVDDLLSEFEPSIHSARVEGVFRAVDRGEYYDKQEGDQTDPYGKSPWNPPYSNLHLSSSQIYATVVEALDLQPGMSFLNLGSGSGYLSTLVGLLIGPNGLNHGIELHKDVVEYANKRLEHFKRTSSAIDKFDFAEPTFVSGNFLNFNPNHRYDRVYLGAECLPSALRFVMQLVKPGGGILVMPYEENLMRHVRLGESKWHSESLMTVIFTIMIGLGPLVGHDGELQEQRMIEIPLSSTRSLKDLCRIVIRQQLRLKTELTNPELANSDNLDRRRELRKREKLRRLRLREAQQREEQGECKKCRRDSWRSTAGLSDEPTQEGDGEDDSDLPASTHQRLLSRLRNQRRHSSNRQRPSNNRPSRDSPMDYADEEDWSFALRSNPRRRLFNRPLGGASSARPFRDITFEDILLGHPPLSDLMRYRPPSPSPRPPLCSTRRVQGEQDIDQQDFVMDLDEPQPESSSSSSSSSYDDDSSSSSSSSPSSSDSEPHITMRLEHDDSSSDCDLDSENNDSDDIIIVDSGDDHHHDERQVSARESRLRRMWSDFFRGLEPAASHWLASSDDDGNEDNDGEEDEEEEEPSSRVSQPAPKCRRCSGRNSQSEQRPATTDESRSISCRLRSSERRARGATRSICVPDGAGGHERVASPGVDDPSPPLDKSINPTATTTHDSSTSAGPITRSAARSAPCVLGTQVAATAAATNCPPPTGMSDVAHQSHSPTAARASERKRKRQSSSSSSSSSSLSLSSSSLSDDELGDESSSSLSSCDAASRRQARPSQRRRRAHRRSRCPRGSSIARHSPPLLGRLAHTARGVTGGTSVAIDSRGVMSTMTTRVIMAHDAAAAGQDGAAPLRDSRALRRATETVRAAAQPERSCGLPTFSPFVRAETNNDNNEQVPRTSATATATTTRRQRRRLALAAGDETPRPLESDHQNQRTGSRNHHHRRDCKHRGEQPAGGCARQLRALRVERQRRARNHQHRHQVESRLSCVAAAAAAAAATRYQSIPRASPSGADQNGASSTSGSGPPRLSECDQYRSHMSASIRELPLPTVLRDYLNHERDF